MSHWGKIIASNVFIYFIYIFYKGVYCIKEGKQKISKYNINIKCEKRSDVINFNKELNNDIISIIYGTLLGDGYAEKRIGGKGTRISFYQESSHYDYLLYLHSLVSNLGYCNTKLPKIQTRLGNKGKIRNIIRFHTWTYTQFNWIHNEWYVKNNNLQNTEGIKRVPLSINKYLTPLALAIWIMDDGCLSNKGLKLATNSFKYNDLLTLKVILQNKYNIKSSIVKTGVKDQYNIYILKESMSILVNIVKPYIIPSMKYKFNHPNIN